MYRRRYLNRGELAERVISHAYLEGVFRRFGTFYISDGYTGNALGSTAAHRRVFTTRPCVVSGGDGDLEFHVRNHLVDDLSFASFGHFTAYWDGFVLRPSDTLSSLSGSRTVFAI